MSEGPSTSPRGPSPVALVAATLALCLLGLALGLNHPRPFNLTLGTIHEPTRDLLMLLAAMTSVGLAATFFATRAGVALLTGDRLERLRRAFLGVDDRRFGLFLFLAGVGVPLVLRVALLREAPLTDDESSYLFGARLLAQGHLFLPSPDWPVFFDNGFLVNDGRLYSQYFVGWPALLAIGERLGVPGLVNPVLHGLTAVLVERLGRQRLGPGWGRVAALLYVGSLFLDLSAATLMSHTASTFALAATLALVERARDAQARPWVSALLALSFCLAFFVRPATALGFGGPLVLAWAWGLRSRPGRGLHAAAFAAVALVGAGLFLEVNALQTGSPWRTGYHAVLAHLQATKFRFGSTPPAAAANEGFLFFFVQKDPWVVLSKYVMVAIRLWLDAHGFPLGFALAFVARRQTWRWLAGPCVGLLLAHLPLADVGIDTFGPVHFTELMLPLVLLLADGLRTVHRFATGQGAPAVAPALLVACALGSLVFYAPSRLVTIARLVADIRAPLEAFEAAPPSSIVFTRFPFAPACVAKPSQHFVLFRPNNPPGEEPARLWANHVDLENDRRLVERRPGWTGYLLRQDPATCVTRLVPLAEATEAEFPARVKLLPGDLDVTLRRR